MQKCETGFSFKYRPTRLAFGVGVKLRSNGIRVPVVGAIEDVSQLLIGEDPRRIEHLWQMMYRQHFWHGNDIVRGTAISGIDIALWDIAGKIHNIPCHELLGGRVRDYIRLYCHLGGGKMEDFYQTKPDDAKRFAELAGVAVEHGFTAFKSMAVPETMSLEGLKPIQYAEACVRAMRDIVGDEIDIYGRLPCETQPKDGIAICKSAGAVRIIFFLKSHAGRNLPRISPYTTCGQNADRYRRAPGGYSCFS